MRLHPAFLIRSLLLILVCFPNLLLAEEPTSPIPAAPSKSSMEAQHIYGLPEASAKARGALRLTATELIFSSNSGSSTVPLASVRAVSAGNQRVELWGTKGRVFRMLIPNGGGLAAAGFMHHKIDTLTVEFLDKRGGYHGAVFALPANQAQGILDQFGKLPAAESRRPASFTCEQGISHPRTIRVTAPVSDQEDLPSAYRMLVYEHLVDRLQKSKKFDFVYREGESDTDRRCAQYAVELSLTGFKQGSQVKRATMGPVGMFVGATQMDFDVKVSDAQGNIALRQQGKASVHTESESITVTDRVAKKLSKRILEVQNHESTGNNKN